MGLHDLFSGPFSVRYYKKMKNQTLLSIVLHFLYDFYVTVSTVFSLSFLVLTFMSRNNKSYCSMAIHNLFSCCPLRNNHAVIVKTQSFFIVLMRVRICKPILQNKTERFLPFNINVQNSDCGWVSIRFSIKSQVIEPTFPMIVFLSVASHQ